MMASTDESMNFDYDQEECMIKFSSKASKKTPVFLVNFSNGKLRSNDQPDIKFQSYRSTQFPERESKMTNRILLANNGRLQYSGPSFGNSFENKNETRYMLGVRNIKKGKMKLYDSVSFRLKPIISILNTDTDNSSASKSIREKKDELISCFGSKLGKRAMNSRIKYATKDEDITPIVKELEQLPLLETSKTTTPATSDIIPQQNLLATNIAEVYSIDNFISEEEMSALEEKAKEIIVASEAEIMQWKSDESFCNFFLHHIEKEELNIEKCKLLIYLNYLICFSKLLSRDLKRKNPAENIPYPYRNYILQNFTLCCYESGRPTYKLPLAMKDKVIAHIMVLALFVSDFKVNFSLIIKDVKIAVTKLTTIAQLLGCHVTQSKENKFAELKFPLYVIPPKRFVTKKKFNK